MSTKQTPCSPLHFKNQFLKLLSEMDGAIHRLPFGASRTKMIRYQTLIAAGGYFGPRAKELLNLKWIDIVHKTETKIFEYKTSKIRSVYFSKTFIRYADTNFKLIDPVNIHHLVLHKKNRPMEPVSTRDFNESFAAYLKMFGIETDNPSSHTLRKTFMNAMWHELGGTEQAYLTVGKMMGYQDKSQVMDYLGHTKKQIKEAVHRLP